MFKLTPVNGAEINGRAAKYWLLTSTSGNVLFEVNTEKRTVKALTQEATQKIPVLFERFDPDTGGGEYFEWFSSSGMNEVVCFFDAYYIERDDTRVVHAPGGTGAFSEVSGLVLYPYGCNPWDPFYDMDCMDMALCDYTYEGVRRKDWFVKKATWMDEGLKRLGGDLYMHDGLCDESRNPRLHSILKVVKAKDYLEDMKGRTKGWSEENDGD